MRCSRRRSWPALVALVVVLGFGPGAAPAPADDASLTVFAAASLTTAFRAIATAFESEHPRAKVAFNFAGSATLVQQIRDGARADVFASADASNMQKLVDAAAVRGTPRIFAQNVLQIAVAKGNPRHIAGLADLSRPGLVVVLCAETVPCGRYALEAFTTAGATVPLGSRELDVKAVVSKIALGEADAGIVYVTDVRAASGEIEGIDLAPAHTVSARYPIAVLRDATHPELAEAFVAFVVSEPGSAILGKYGFVRP